MSSTLNQTISSISPTSGSLTGGQTITITGTGFSGTSPSINFGAAGGSNITVVSDTEITVTNPNVSAPISVKVDVLFKGVATKAGTFDYRAPVITSISPKTTNINGSKTITINGKYFTGTQAVNFGAMGGGNVKVISDSKITVTNPNSPKSQIVDVVVITQNNASVRTSNTKFSYTSLANNGVPFLFKTTTKKVFIHFLGAKTIDGFYYDKNSNKQTLAVDTAYKLSDISNLTSFNPKLPSGTPGVVVKAFSGRIYVSLNKKLKCLGSGYTPAAGTSSDPNYKVYYQYFEPTVVDSQLNVDLSYIDFTAFSLSLFAKNAPYATNGTQKSTSSLALVKAAAAAASSTNASVLPSSNKMLPSSKFARVISPQLSASSMYHDFTNYLKTFLAGKQVTIKGIYAGTNKQPSSSPETQAQSYDYTGTFATNGSITLSPNSDSGNGKANGVPTAQQGTGVGNATGNIVISFSDLNSPIGVYGCNAPYTLGSNPKTKGITNDFYGQVVGDVYAGLNFGFIGSTVAFGSTTIGDLSSTAWWGGTLPDGSIIQPKDSPGGKGIYFKKAQPANDDYYNSYSGNISDLTTGYGFPLQDRLGQNLLTLNTSVDSNAYLEIDID